MAIETRTEVTGGSGLPVSTPAAVVPVRYYPTTAVSLGLFFLRVPLGAYFLLAGVGKFRGDGVAKFVESNLGKATYHMMGNEGLAKTFLNAVPFAEIVLGAMLVVGLLTRFAGLLCSLLLVSFITAHTKFGTTTPSLQIHSNLIFLGASLAILLCGPGRLSVDNLIFGRRRKVTVTEQYTERLP